jgi:hypothetical protein
MTDRELIIWIKGLVDGIQDEQVPDKNQWDILKKTVKDHVSKSKDLNSWYSNNTSGKHIIID